MINILICDDCREHCLLIKYLINRYQSLNKEIVFNTYCTESSIDVINYMNNNLIDIAILDIEIDERNGIDLAKQIKQNNKNTFIIFITSYVSYCYEAYQTEAFGYILKPINREAFNQILDKIIKYKNESDFIEKYMQPKLAIKFNGKISTITQQEILYIEKFGKKVKVFTEGSIYEYTSNLKDLEKMLEKEMFIRCHQGFIININHIIGYKKLNIYISSKKICIPVSKSNSEKLKYLIEKKLWGNAL